MKHSFVSNKFTNDFNTREYDLLNRIKNAWRKLSKMERWRSGYCGKVD